MSFTDDHGDDYADGDGNGGWVPVLVAGLVVGALVMGIIWAGWAWTGSGDPEVEPQLALPTATERTTEPADPVTDSAATTPLERCREVYDAQTGPLAAAQDSLDQWEVHIGAMNKLVTGAITLPQARQFWNQTRVGATARLESYDAADREFARRTARCPAPQLLAGADQDLQACQQAVADRNRVLRLSATALETWRMHVHHMEMLRDGTMSAEEATQLWLQSWRQGDRQVKAYRAAAKTAGDQTC